MTITKTAHENLRGELRTCAAVETFVRAGNATLTIVSRSSGTRFTFKFVRPKLEAQTAERPIWVRLLNGPDNEGDFVFLGTMWPTDAGLTYRHSAKAGVDLTAPSVLAVQWLVKVLNMKSDTALAQAEVWHEGRCARCGRKLTVPSSIASGFGPECSTRA